MTTATQTGRERETVNSWDKFLDRVKSRVSINTFTTWFQPTRLNRAEGEILFVQIPSAVFRQVLTRTYGEIAARLRASGATHSVAQAIARNPFMIIVPCHRVLEAGGYADKISPNGGTISKRRLLSIEGAGSTTSKTLFEVLLPVAPPRPQS